MDDMAEKLDCCSNGPVDEHSSAPWLIGSIPSGQDSFPRVATRLTWADTLGRWKVRWALGRDRYTVQPGLYAVGEADSDSLVFVTANYKMSFDCLRSALHNRNAWILVLDTAGINVWCAAGKRTFGTDNLVDSVANINLAERVNHRKLILPQLGASGISAHIVSQRTGFKIVYGPVRSVDLPAFLDSSMKATPQMRKVEFGMLDRLRLTPVELAISIKYILFAMLVALVASGVSRTGYDLHAAPSRALPALTILLSSWLAGAFFGPVLLPFFPVRSFAAKGAIAGLLAFALAAGVGITQKMTSIETCAWAAIAISIASFLTMNFTGASTFTSPSGVRKEMRAAVPAQIVGILGGIVLLIINLFT